jgi:diaminopimelate decarboxylase
MNIEYKALAEKYGTPLYMYDFDYIEDRYTTLKDAFAGKKSLINYAVKANSNLSVIAHLAKLGAGADCVSIGEVRRALDAGVDRYKIIFSGVGKRDDEIREALEKDILLINLESEAEMKRVEMVAKELGKEARISVRVIQILILRPIPIFQPDCMKINSVLRSIWRNVCIFMQRNQNFSTLWVSIFILVHS